MDVQEIYNAFAGLENVEALAFGGSRASGNYDRKSDYDIYVYVTDKVDEEKRKEILSEYCEQMEIGNKYWEYEDNVILKGGTGMDIIYRTIESFDNYVKFVIEEGNAMNGYTTCFWHNIKTSKIIFDKTGRYTQLQKRCDIPYPEKLKKNIINKNMKLLSGVLPSYDKQILKAYERHDFVSINHRVSAFMESYFDVIFAINEMTHPGEKKLIKICCEQCKLLPARFKENIVGLFEYMFKFDVSDILEDMVNELKNLIEENKI